MSKFFDCSIVLGYPSKIILSRNFNSLIVFLSNSFTISSETKLPLEIFSSICLPRAVFFLIFFFINYLFIIGSNFFFFLLLLLINHLLIVGSNYVYQQSVEPEYLYQHQVVQKELYSLRNYLPNFVFLISCSY